jgi:type IV pilus assembly protein PilE
MKKYTKGFTLIELLVVIAIIGILSSVVLVSLNTARNKGNLAKVQSQINSARASAEIYYSGSNNYGTATATCNNMFSDTNSGMATYTNTANYPAGVSMSCGSSSTNYALMATFTGTTPTSYVCIDSKGIATTTTTAITTVASNSDPKCQ